MSRGRPARRRRRRSVAVVVLALVLVWVELLRRWLVVLLLLLRLVVLLLLLLLQVQLLLMMMRVASTSSDSSNSDLLLLLRERRGVGARAGAVDLAPLAGDEVLGAAGELGGFWGVEILGGGEEKRVRKERLKGRRRTRTREAVGVFLFFALPLRFLSPRAGGRLQRGRGERVKRERESTLALLLLFPRHLSILSRRTTSKLGFRSAFFFFAAGSLFLSLSLSR